MSITRERFGVLSSGRAVDRYTLKNEGGLSVSILNYGGVIQSLLVPSEKSFFDVVCGYDTLASYEMGDGYQGAVIGRYANRIAGGRFSLEGQDYTLYQNDGENSLHGGKCGFDKKIFDVDAVDGEEPRLVLSCVSPDGEEGYPGTLSLTVTYTLTKQNGLSIAYRAVSDKKTVVNLTNHAYFNLGGFDSGSVLGHELWLDAQSYLPTDAGLIPTGVIHPVGGTPFDFRVKKTLGADFSLKNPDLALAGGYDHCLNFAGGGTFCHRATLYCRESGISMEMWTDQPSVQLYTGNFLKNAAYPFKGGCAQRPQMAVCLETQKMPDSVHHEGFTDVVLKAGEVYEHRTEYRFLIK